MNLISTKVNKGLNVLRRLSEFLDLETLLIAYKTLVQPYFDYWSQVWGGLGSPLLDKQQSAKQSSAHYIITKCVYEVRSPVLLEHLDLISLETRMNQQLATLMYKVRHSMVHSSISSLFQRTDDIHNHQTRQLQFNYLPPKPINTNFKKKTISYRGAVAWNNLPCDLKRSQSIQSFKNKL